MPLTLRDVLEVLSSAAVSTALSAILVFLSREWISTRLKASIQHEYAEKLETLKAQIKAEHEVRVLNIKTAFEREATLQAAAHRSFSEGQKAAMERKLEAIDRLWLRVVHLRVNLPAIITLIDCLTVEEYRRDKDHAFFQALTGDLSPQKLGEILKQDGERPDKSRPYVGEYMWYLFYCYEVILIRLITVMFISNDDVAKVEWYKEKGTRQFIVAVLLPDELKEFDQLQFGRVPWLQRVLESKILAAAEMIVSGQKFGSDSLVQAHAIQRLVAQAEVENQRTKANAAVKP